MVAFRVTSLGAALTLAACLLAQSRTLARAILAGNNLAGGHSAALEARVASQPNNAAALADPRVEPERALLALRLASPRVQLEVD